MNLLAAVLASAALVACDDAPGKRDLREVVFAPAASAGPSAELAFLYRYLLLCQNTPPAEKGQI